MTSSFSFAGSMAWFTSLIHTEISRKLIGWIVVKFGTDIHCPQMMKSEWLVTNGDSQVTQVTFALVPPAGSHLWLLVKGLENYWMVYHEFRYRCSCPPLCEHPRRAASIGVDSSLLSCTVDDNTSFQTKHQQVITQSRETWSHYYDCTCLSFL